MDSTPLIRSHRVTKFFCCSHNCKLCSCFWSLIVTAVLVLILVVTLRGSDGGGDVKVYSYFLFTRRWPPTACLSAGKCVPTAANYTNWTIHGLWPEFSNNTWDQFCRKDYLDLKVLEPIESRLVQEWPNLHKGENISSLWSHEWLKHGTCTAMTEFDYFNRTLALNQDYPLTQWLTQGNIKPSSSETYTLDDFHRTLASHFNLGSIAINCEVRKGEEFLSEIMFCFSFNHDLRLFKPIDCTIKSSCRGKLRYIPFGPTA